MGPIHSERAEPTDRQRTPACAKNVVRRTRPSRLVPWEKLRRPFAENVSRTRRRARDLARHFASRAGASSSGPRLASRAMSPSSSPPRAIAVVSDDDDDESIPEEYLDASFEEDASADGHGDGHGDPDATTPRAPPMATPDDDILDPLDPARDPEATPRAVPETLVPSARTSPDPDDDADPGSSDPSPLPPVSPPRAPRSPASPRFEPPGGAPTPLGRAGTVRARSPGSSSSHGGSSGSPGSEASPTRRKKMNPVLARDERLARRRRDASRGDRRSEYPEYPGGVDDEDLDLAALPARDETGATVPKGAAAKAKAKAKPRLVRVDLRSTLPAFSRAVAAALAASGATSGYVVEGDESAAFPGNDDGASSSASASASASGRKKTLASISGPAVGASVSTCDGTGGLSAALDERIRASPYRTPPAHRTYAWYKHFGFAGKGAKTSWGFNPKREDIRRRYEEVNAGRTRATTPGR